MRYTGKKLRQEDVNKTDPTCAGCKSQLVEMLFDEIREWRAIRVEAARVAEAFIKFEVLNNAELGFDDGEEFSAAEDEAFVAVSALKDAILLASKKRGKRGGKP